MKQKFKKVIAGMLCIALAAGNISFGEITKTKSLAAGIETETGFAAGYFDGMNLTEREEFQSAYLADYVTGELLKKPSAKSAVTEGEFYRLVLNTEEIMGIKVGEHAKVYDGFKYDFLADVEKGDDSREITRIEAAEFFLGKFHSQELGKEFGLSPIWQSDWGGSVWGTHCAEELDESLSEDEKGKMYIPLFMLKNTDRISGLPLMENDSRGYFRFYDKLTVKEAVQLVFRYSRRHEEGTVRYVNMDSEAATNPLTLTAAELSMAANMPEYDYGNMPEYNSINYQFGSEILFCYESDFRMLADMGINLLDFRIPYNKFLTDDKKINLDLLEIIDAGVHYAAKYGMHLRFVLEASWDDVRFEYFYNGKTADGTKTRGFGTEGFSAEQFMNWYKSVYSTLAARYRNVPKNLVSFHLFNETIEYDCAGHDSVFADVCYEIADAVWAVSPGRIISTDGLEGGNYPSKSLAERGVARNTANQGKADYFDQRIAQTTKIFGEWEAGFYWEAPTTRSPFYVIPDEMKYGTDTAFVINGNTDGFSAGTTIRVMLNPQFKVSDGNSADNLQLVAYDEAGNVTESISKGECIYGNTVAVFTLTKNAKKLKLSRKNLNDYKLEYILITYPETADRKIPISNFFKDGTGKGREGYTKDEYSFADTNADKIDDLVNTYVKRFSDKKQTYINFTIASLAGVNHGFQKADTYMDMFYPTEVNINIQDGDNNQKYTASFKGDYDKDGTPEEYSLTYKQFMEQKLWKMKDFSKKYGTKILCREIGSFYHMEKADYMEIHRDQMEVLREMGLGLGCFFMMNGCNSGLFDGYVIGGDFVKYEKFYVDKDILKLTLDSIKGFEISDIPDMRYTGSQIQPEPVVKYNGTTLTKGTDYELHYGENTECGMGQILVTGKDSYAGIFTEKSFLISILSNPIVLKKSYSAGLYSDASFKTMTEALGRFDTLDEIGTALSGKEGYLKINIKNDVPLSSIPYAEGIKGVTAAKADGIGDIVIHDGISLPCDLYLSGENIVVPEAGATINGNHHKLILGKGNGKTAINGGTLKTENLTVIIAGNVTVNAGIDGLKALSINETEAGYTVDPANENDIFSHLLYDNMMTNLIINKSIENVEKLTLWGAKLFVQENGALSVSEIDGLFGDVFLYKNSDEKLAKLSVSRTMKNMIWQVRIYAYDTLNVQNPAETAKLKTIKQGSILAFLSKDGDGSLKEKLGFMPGTDDDTDWEYYNNKKTVLNNILYYDDGSTPIDPNTGENETPVTTNTPATTNTPDATNTTDTTGTTDITVRIADVTRKYGEANPAFDFVIKEGKLAEGDTRADLAVTMTTEAGEASNVGTYEITGTSASTKYNVTVEKGVLTVTQADGRLMVPDEVITKTRTDAAFSLNCGTNGDGLITYTVSNSKDMAGKPVSDEKIIQVAADGMASIIGAGSCDVTVKLSAGVNYTAAPDKQIRVVVGDSEKNFRVADISPVAYKGGEVKPEVYVYDGRMALTLNKDYTLEYKNNKEVNYITSDATWLDPEKKPYVKVKGKGNYSGSSEVYFEIMPPDIAGAAVSDLCLVYTGRTLNVDPVVYFEGNKLTSKDYNVTTVPEEVKDAGIYDVTITGCGNYGGTVKCTLTVVSKASEKVSILSVKKAAVKGLRAQDYTGKAIEPHPEVTVKGKTLTENTDYILAYKNNTKAGTATVSICGKGNYGGVIKKTFRINPKRSSDPGISASVETPVIYSKAGAKPAVTVYDGDARLVAGRDYTLTYKNKKPGKTSKVVIKFRGNYKGSKSVEYEIAKANLKDIDFYAPDKVYSGKAGAYKSSPVLTDSGKKLKAGTDYEKAVVYTTIGSDGQEKTLAKKDKADPGASITVTIKGKGNYEGTVSCAYRILQAGHDLSKATVAVSSTAETIYTGSAVTLSKDDIRVTLAGNALDHSCWEIVGYTNNINKGNATVTIAGCGEYGGRKSAKFTILPKPMKADEEIPESKTLDRELNRARSYGFIPEEWFDMYQESSNHQLTTKEYYSAVLSLIEKIDKNKISSYEEYFKKDMDPKRHAYTCEGMLMAYLAIYELTNHRMYMDPNFETAVMRQDESCLYTIGESLILPEKANSAKLEWVNDRYDWWDIDFCAYVFMINENTPVTGKPAFAFAEDKKDSKFIMEKLSVDDAIRSLSRVYEFIKFRRREIKKQPIGYGIDELADKRREEIRNSPTEVTCSGTAYYVAADGSDDNDGRSPEKPLKTLTKVNSLVWSLKPGDAVFFKRGDVFRGVLSTQEGVTYSAYGEGKKPILTTSPEDGAGEEKWTLFQTGDDGRKIWKYYRNTEPYGSIQFNNFAETATKVMHISKDGKKLSVSRIGEDFDLLKDLENLEFYNTNDDKFATDWGELAAKKNDGDYSDGIYGELYLRCDDGNPGVIFSNIEFGTSAQNIINANGITVDNLCFYLGQTGFAIHQNNHQTVQNCEFAYQGGAPCGSNMQGGDGITLGGQYNLIKNNYVHECWDDGIAMEMLPDVGQYHDISIQGNLVEDCNGGILFANWFMGNVADKDIPVFENFHITDNYVLYCGYSWSRKARNSYNNQTIHMTSGMVTGCNEFVRFKNATVSNNVFAMSTGALIATAAIKGEPLKFSGNTYINDGVFVANYDAGSRYLDFYSGDELDKVKACFGDTNGMFYAKDRKY